MQTRVPTEATTSIPRPTTPTRPASRSRRGRPLRLAIVVIAATAFLASAAVATANDRGMSGFGPLDGIGGARGFGRGSVDGQIAITAIDGNDLALKTADGWTRTITVTSATTITEAGQTISAGDLDVGDTIRFSQTASSTGTYTIDAIVVVTPTVVGTVTEVGSGSFKLTAREGTTWTIATNGDTAYTLGLSNSAKAGTAADLKVGSSVVVQGTAAANNAMTAVTVRIQLPRVGGQVTATTGDTITVTRRDGSTTVIHVSSGTTYQVVGKTSATLADITVGMAVMAEGVQRSDGSIDASTIVGGTVGGRGWFGPRVGPDAAPSASPSGTTNG